MRCEDTEIWSFTIKEIAGKVIAISSLQDSNITISMSEVKFIELSEVKQSHSKLRPLQEFQKFLKTV